MSGNDRAPASTSTLPVSTTRQVSRPASPPPLDWPGSSFSTRKPTWRQPALSGVMSITAPSLSGSCGLTRSFEAIVCS
jgi:hypothetical protein